MKPTTPQWYAVYTKPKWEKKVAELLTRRQVQAYCPLNKELKQWHDRKKWVLVPLFTSYVFVRVTPEQSADVRKTTGVLNFVYWLGKPALIRDEEIATIHVFLAQHRNVVVEKIRVQVGDRVKIITGLLSEQEGTVVEARNKTVKVLLPTLGFALVATMDKEHVEAIEPVKQTGIIIRA